MILRDRVQAGLLLLDEVRRLNLARPVVLGIPRGGVIVAAEVAKGLRAPLDVIIPRKIGAPFNPELAVGAVTQDGTLILDDSLKAALRVDDRYIQMRVRDEIREIERRLEVFRRGLPPMDLASADVVVVDDGIATGLTITAALRSVSAQSPSSTVLAVPVAPTEALERLSGEVDHLVCLASPEPFYAVGQWYARFDQVEDEEVIAALRECR
ncbi:MAG: phosphoribosyltransferase family protein [Firmicutes bacterium]|nr:phosphoribosyltransferase family protein [Bacillota bacterium]